MTRKLGIAAFALALIAGIASSGMFKSQQRAAAANTETTAASPPSGVCDIGFVKNVRIKALGRNEFDVSWEYDAPDPCMKPEFEVVVRIKRKVGGGILGEKTLKAGPSDRHALVGFGSVFGIDEVHARVTGTITLKRFDATVLDL